jgi:hypothetical protein
MKDVPPTVVTLWMPAFFLLGMYLFLNGMRAQYWSICVPLVPLLAYMNTLAEIHSSGGKLRIKRWWGSVYIAKSEVLDISPSMLQGIGRLHFRRFMPPWGVIYFVTDWSTLELPEAPSELLSSKPAVATRERVPDVLASVLMGGSGFVVGKMLSGEFRTLSVEGTLANILALTIAGALGTSFLLTRKKTPTLANVLLYLAALIVAFVREPYNWW